MINNGFIAAYINHPIIKNFIDLCMFNVNNQLYNENNLDVTGPRTFGRVFNRFFNRTDNEIIQRGQYLINDFKFKMLYLDVNWTDHEVSFYVDINNTKNI